MNITSPEAVTITATIRKTAENKNIPAMLALRFIIAVLGCCGAAFSFLSCFDVGVSKLSVVLVIVGVNFVSLIFTAGKFIGGFYVFVIGTTCMTVSMALRDKFAAGYFVFTNMYMSIARSEFREKPYMMIIEPELADEHLKVFVLMVIAGVCLVVGYSIQRLDTGTYASCALCGLVAPAFIIGLEPDYKAFTAFVVSIAILLVTDFVGNNTIRKKQFLNYRLQCSAFAGVIAFLCLACVFAFTELIDYERPERLNQIYEDACDYIESGKMKKEVSKAVSKLTGHHIVDGAINHGKLDEFGQIYFDYDTVLQITMPKSTDSVYLRGFVGSVYTGRSWEELSEGKLRELEEITENFTTDSLSPILLDSYNLKNAHFILPHYSFTIKNIDANKDYLYLPYNLVPESVSRYSIENNSHFTGPSDTYFGQIYDPSGYQGYQNLFRKRWSIPSVLLADEAAYRNFVYENYLDIPTVFDPTEIFNESYYHFITAEEIQTGKSTLDEMTVFSRKLYYIRNWLRDNCEYSLTTEPLPKGEDFVNHFLKYRKGSCSHFSTTAVMMCRYAGIPARYVEGYVVKPMDSDPEAAVGEVVTIDVTDSRGHAWVEVYIDGYGWYPVEFTSGYGNIRTAVPTEATVTEPVEETESEIVQETTVTQEDADEPAENTSPQPDSTETAAEQESTVDTESETVTTAPPETPEETNRDTVHDAAPPTVGFGFFEIEGDNKVDVVYDLTWVLVVLLVIVMVPAVILVRRKIIIFRRKSSDTPSGQVLRDYSRFEKLLKIMGMPKQNEMDYSEYAELLYGHSPLFKDGSASQIVSLALKASFGGDIVTRDEAHEMRVSVTSLIKRHYNTLSLVGKFKIKYIYCLI